MEAFLLLAGKALEPVLTHFYMKIQLFWSGGKTSSQLLGKVCLIICLPHTGMLCKSQLVSSFMVSDVLICLQNTFLVPTEPKFLVTSPG